MRCFSVDNFSQTSMLFDFHDIGNMAFRNFRLEVANKKPLFTQNLPLHKLKLPVKKAFFYNYKILWAYPRLYYTGNMLLAVLKNEWAKNHMKLILNTWTWKIIKHLQIMSAKKRYGRIRRKVTSFSANPFISG